MTMLTSSLENIGIADAGVASVLGYAVVFVGLIALMAVVIIMGKIFTAKKAAAPTVSAPAPVAAPAPAAVPAPVAAFEAAPVAAAPGDAAPGTAGKLKIYDVNPKTAAMLMAIVANKMNKPLNELRFISIKEVK